MIGNQDRWQEDLFVAGPLRGLIPEDHVLRRVDQVLDLSWLREEVKDCYCEDNGRPGIDPEAAVRLMPAGLVNGDTVHIDATFLAFLLRWLWPEGCLRTPEYGRESLWVARLAPKIRKAA